MRNGPIRNMNTVHRELSQNRKDREQASQTLGIFPLKKDGNPYKLPSLTARTMDEAKRLQTRLTGLNPGSVYIIKGV